MDNAELIEKLKQVTQIAEGMGEKFNTLADILDVANSRCEALRSELAARDLQVLSLKQQLAEAKGKPVTGDYKLSNLVRISS